VANEKFDISKLSKQTQYDLKLKLKEKVLNFCHENIDNWVEQWVDKIFADIQKDGVKEEDIIEFWVSLQIRDTRDVIDLFNQVINKSERMVLKWTKLGK
jgi:hypothetical protein